MTHKPTDNRTIGVVGAGVMGAGISQVCLSAGYDVILHDKDDRQLQQATAAVEKGLERMVGKGNLTAEAKSDHLSRLSPTPEVDALAASSIVIEAVLEDLDAKRMLFRHLDNVCAAEVTLASNTSSLSISAIADATRRPERVVGLHFFNPAPVMKLVEIVRGIHTATTTFDATWSLAQKLGKTPVEAVDLPGFIVSRVLDVMINEAVRCVMAGNDPQAVDEAMVLGCNLPMGPLALADLMGIDVLLKVLERLQSGLGPGYEPAPLLREMVRQQKLGRKTGAGFYNY